MEDPFEMIRKMIDEQLKNLFNDEESLFNFDTKSGPIDIDFSKFNNGNDNNNNNPNVFSKSLGISYSWSSDKDKPEIKITGDLTPDEKAEIEKRIMEGKLPFGDFSMFASDIMSSANIPQIIKGPIDIDMSGPIDIEANSNNSEKRENYYEPFVDIEDNGSNARVILEMPGVNPKKIKIKQNKKKITIEADGINKKFRKEITLSFKPKGEPIITGKNGIISIEFSN